MPSFLDELAPDGIDEAPRELAHRFESRCLRAYLANVIALPGKTRSGRRISRALVRWIAEHDALLGLEDVAIDADEHDSQGWLKSEAGRQFARALLPRLKAGRAPLPSPLEKRLAWIAETLDLSATDAQILGLAVRAALFTPVHALACAAEDNHRAEDEINRDAVARLAAMSPRVVRERLRRGRPLLQLGLLEDRNGGDYAPSRTVLRIARLGTTDPERLRAAMFGKAPGGTLAWSDFAHLGEARDLALNLLEGALTSREAGVGILLYGVPGGGKTEFARTLAKRLKARAVFIGEADEEDGEPSRSERIAHFALTGTLARAAGRMILVVDEADDIFTGVDEDDRAARTGSKVFMNRLVERCPAPTIWITNTPGRLGEAVVRRMSLAVHFRAPGRPVRRRIVERLARKRKLDLAPRDLDRLAAVEAAPALLDAGLRAAALTGGDVASALDCTSSLLAAMGRAAPPPALPGATAFDPALSSADCDLAALAERVVATRETALSFCFHGLPGTGKSAYARYLASRLGLEVIEKRASDLLSMWVGGTEQLIAAAFREAADARAMLVLDEADSLLRDRGLADRSWEVTQVNEMLTWMERHPYPFVCTTNAMDALDPATMRRFLFKVRFLAMSVSQAREAFRRAFGVEAPAALDRLDPLTPGDFAVVARKARVLGEREPAALVAMLAEEVAAKPGVGRQRIGF